MNEASIESRIAAVEDELAIRNLVASYVFAIDDRDLDTVASLFTERGVFASRDNVMNATGRQAVVDQFKGRYTVLGISNHMTHDHWVKLEGPARARGHVSSHAELVRNGQPCITALRYADTYEKEDGAWRFAERRLSFLYYLDMREYLSGFVAKDRNRAYATPGPADYPEQLPTWKDYPPSGS